MGSKVKSSGFRQPISPSRSSKESEDREHLAQQHLMLVRRLCQRYRYSGVAMEDLVQIGSIGLLKAIDKFDPDRGSAFLSFAVPVIVGEIKNYFRDHGWAVKIPRKVQKHKQIVERTVESLTHMRGRSPKVNEIAEATGLSMEEVYDTFEAGKYGHLMSLEAQYEYNGQGDVTTVLDYLGEDDPQFEELADRMDLLKTLSCLTTREKRIIKLKFFAGLSQSEIAGQLGISQMHVSRLQRAALSKLRINLVGVGESRSPGARGSGRLASLTERAEGSS